MIIDYNDLNCCCYCKVEKKNRIGVKLLWLFIILYFQFVGLLILNHSVSLFYERI